MTPLFISNIIFLDALRTHIQPDPVGVVGFPPFRSVLSRMDGAAFVAVKLEAHQNGPESLASGAAIPGARPLRMLFATDSSALVGSMSRAISTLIPY